MVWIVGERVRVHLAVLTLGYSRRLVVRAFRGEKQNHWLEALEEGFRHWGGVPQEVLMDNARARVSQHDPERQILVFAQRLEEFARYWDFWPRACRPYRARMKGKDERGVAYVRQNAIAGGSSTAGRNWRPIWCAGPGRWPTCASTAPPVRSGWSGSCGRNPKRCDPLRTCPLSWL